MNYQWKMKSKYIYIKEGKQNSYSFHLLEKK